MKPNIFVVGASGTGKSTSIRGLDPKRTIILNTEQKALPFRGAGKFKMNVPIADVDEFEDAFKRALESDKADVIVIESFTSLTEHIYRDLGKAYFGFDFWDAYKKELMRILHMSKNTDKYVIMLGIDQVLEGSGGVEERFISVDGSLKKKVEKEFVIVLFSDCVTEEGKPVYRFITNKQQGFEHASCKSPMEMLPETMGNDLGEVIKSVDKYYEEENEEGAE
jgi:hypothetical protein